MMHLQILCSIASILLKGPCCRVHSLELSSPVCAYQLAASSLASGQSAIHRRSTLACFCKKKVGYLNQKQKFPQNNNVSSALSSPHVLWTNRISWISIMAEPGSISADSSTPETKRREPVPNRRTSRSGDSAGRGYAVMYPSLSVLHHRPCIRPSHATIARNAAVITLKYVA